VCRFGTDPAASALNTGYRAHELNNLYAVNASVFPSIGAMRLIASSRAYRNRRCIVPVDGFFDWKAIKGQRAKQPYAIAMKDGAPFGIAGIWENWKQPASGEWIRTFAVITTDANELVADIHDRMPVILTTHAGSATNPTHAT
jgi:hypothetical protein